MSYLLTNRAVVSVVAGLFALFLIALPLPTPAQLPNLGDGADMTVGAERRLGDRIAREIYRDPDYEDDPQLMAYVGGLWRSLMAAAKARGEITPEIEDRFAWDIVLNRERTINAFALPGGYMGVNLGLIGMVASRDELASVLGHELSHITQRHIPRLIAKQAETTPWLIAAMVLGALAARKNANAANASIVGGQALAAQTQLNFSRDMEREADRVGFGVMTDAGFDPLGFPAMFEKLQQANRINDNGSFPYLRSHPLTGERIADAQARLQLQPASVRRPAPDFVHGMMSARARGLSAPGVDVFRAWVREAQILPPGNVGAVTPVPAPTAGSKAVSAAVAAQQAAARRVGVLYAGVMSATKLRDFAQAKSLLGRLGTAVAGDAEAQRLLNLLTAEVALQEKNPSAALPLVNPSAGRPDLLLWAEAQRALGGPGVADAAQRLTTWTSLHPQDAQAWDTLSNLQTALGQPVQAARSSGESRAAQLDYQAALDRFKAAQDLMRRGSVKGNDYIEASIIDLRARELQAKVRELAREQPLER